MSDEYEANTSAGLGSRLVRGTRPAVLVVDLSNAFTRADHPLGSDMPETLSATMQVLTTARAAQLPVIFTTIAFRSDRSDAGIWMQKAPHLADLITGTRLVDIDDRLGRLPDEPIVEKQGTSAFFGTELITVLVSRGIDTIVLCGASTSGCIRATAVDCLQFGLPCLIPRPCVGDRSIQAHEANLRDLDAKYADVIPLDDALRYLAGASRGGRPTSARGGAPR